MIKRMIMNDYNRPDVTVTRNYQAWSIYLIYTFNNESTRNHFYAGI